MPRPSRRFSKPLLSKKLMYARNLKRLFDCAVAMVALVLLLPLLLVLGIAIRLSDGGPAIFRQGRVGAQGRLFTFYKFRSMPVDTGDIPSDRLGAVRLSGLARFIRRTNLDELPQLLNIVKGDMSFVGPRPPIPQQVELIALRRENGALACRPGLTGLAQVNSYDGMSVDRKAGFDGDYARRITFSGDFVIILRTFGYVLKPPPKY